MVSSVFSTKTKKQKLGAQHVLFMLTLSLVFFIAIFFRMIPGVAGSAIVSLFAPSGELQERIGFVQFDDLVWGSVAKQIENEAAGKPVSAQYLNRQYIFDFTFSERNSAEHGYVKTPSEFYARAPMLGESAVIIEPWQALVIPAATMALVLTLLISTFLPPSLGFMALLIDRQIDNVKVKLRLQSGFADNITDLLIMPDDKLAEQDFNEVKAAYRMIWDRTMTEDVASPYQSARFDDVFDDDTDIVVFRNSAIYNRIREFFSEFVVIEIEDLKGGLLWRRNRLQLMKGLRLYMSHHFTEKYSNVVTGLAYGGAAFLIVAIGVRGLKFIPAYRPSFILLAIMIEFVMLALLAVTLIYTEEEERMDKMLKKMEDANRSQLEALRGQQADIHQLSNALVGQTAEIIRTRVENAIEEYMTSGDQMQKVVAEEIAKKIMFGLREEKPTSSHKSWGGDSRR